MNWKTAAIIIGLCGAVGAPIVWLMWLAGEPFPAVEATKQQGLKQ